jgi:hypothetical protein
MILLYSRDPDYQKLLSHFLQLPTMFDKQPFSNSTHAAMIAEWYHKAVDVMRSIECSAKPLLEAGLIPLLQHLTIRDALKQVFFDDDLESSDDSLE